MEFIHVEGTQTERPLEFDATTSKTVVYIRKNIERKTKTQDGNTYEVWEYDEAQIPMSEFPAVASQIICGMIPTTLSKTAYIDDTEVTFTDVPQGNVSVYMTDKDGQNVPCTFERVYNGIKVAFEKRNSLAEVNISII